MDRMVHGVAKSRTRLSSLRLHFSGKQVLREVFFSSPLYMAPLRQRDAAGVVGSNTSEDSRVCRSCGPVGQVGEGVCPKATSGSRAARCDRLGAERRGRGAPLLAGRLHCGVSRSWLPMRNKMTALRVGVPPPCSGALVSFPHRTREAGRVGPPVPGRLASPRMSQGSGVVANSSCLPPPIFLLPRVSPGARLPAGSQWLKWGDRNVTLCCGFRVCLKFPLIKS